MFETGAPVAIEVLENEGGINRRAWERHAADFKVACGRIADGTEPRLTARVHDICPGGVGLVVQRPFQPGTVLVLKLHKQVPDAPRVLFARVVHIRPHSRIEWIAGCTFASPLDEEEYQALLSQ